MTAGMLAAAERASLSRLAASATRHCMTGCAMGEVLGLAAATRLALAADAAHHALHAAPLADDRYGHHHHG